MFCLINKLKKLWNFHGLISYSVAPWPGEPGGGGAMAPPEKKLSDNFDTCRKFLVHICEI